MPLPERKHPRLKEYDYSQSGCYFVTICVKGKEHLLGRLSVGQDDHILPQVALTQIGEIVDQYINGISTAYPTVSVDAYIIMPNHVHMILCLDAPDTSEQRVHAYSPALPSIIRSFKTLTTKQIGHSIWQTSFYEHIIRNEKGYYAVWKYMLDNPARWYDRTITDNEKLQ